VNSAQHCSVFSALKTSFVEIFLQKMQTNVVSTPLKEGNFWPHIKRFHHGWQVTMKQLILQRLRTSRDNDTPTRQQCRHQICKCFSCACPSLGNQCRTSFNCLSNSPCQLPLADTGNKALNLRGQITTGRETRLNYR
jgi:hypothetical protein